MTNFIAREEDMNSLMQNLFKTRIDPFEYQIKPQL
jgi:hypothetical protein